MHKINEGDASGNQSNICSSSLVYNDISGRHYPPLILRDFPAVSKNQEMCHSKVMTDCVTGKCAPSSIATRNTTSVSHPQKEPNTRNHQVDRKRPSRFQPILPRSVLQPRGQAATILKSPSNEADWSNVTPPTTAEMTPQTPQNANILNGHNFYFHFLQNSTAVKDFPVHHMIVPLKVDTLPSHLDQQRIFLLTHTCDLESAQISTVETPLNTNCHNRNPYYFHIKTGDQVNVQLARKGRETIDSAVRRRKPALKKQNEPEPHDILQAADKWTPCLSACDDPSSDEKVDSGINRDQVFGKVISVEPKIETRMDESQAIEENRPGTEDVGLKRMIRTKQIVRPKRKYAEPLSFDDSDEDCVDLSVLIKTAEKYDSCSKSYEGDSSKGRAVDAVTEDILRRYPPSFMQDLFEDVSNRESYVDAYATALAMNEDSSS